MFIVERLTSNLPPIAFLTLILWGGHAQAGVPECGGMHVAAGAACTVKVSLGCEAQCDLDGVLGKCASELASMCEGECNLSADVECSNDCGSTCESRCKTGDVVCHDGCFDECTVNCPAACEGAEDGRKCRA